MYTGHSSKIILSMNKPHQKKSSIEAKLGYLIIGIFCFTIVLSIAVSAIELIGKYKITIDAPYKLNTGDLFTVNLGYHLYYLAISYPYR
jgi:magnesium-transporting ATPase (P-type)